MITAKPIRAQRALLRARTTRTTLAVMLLAGLAACGGKQDSKNPTQSVASVNGTEITVLQLNDELQRANVPAARQQEGSKQLLEGLIDRQLLLAAASEQKLDRDPKVMQAVERAKALIIAQSYMQKQIGTPAKPTTQEVQAYFAQHPEFFTERKQLDMRQLVFATKDVDDSFSKMVDGAKSLDEVATWFDNNKVRYARAQVSRTTADLPADMSKRLLAMPKGQLFIVREGERSVLTQIADVKPAPVDLATATPQIEQYLLNTRAKEAAQAEIKRLRAAAKIEYLNKSLAPGAAGPAASPTAAEVAGATSPAPAAGTAAPLAPAATPAPAAPAAGAADANVHGVSGLR